MRLSDQHRRFLVIDQCAIPTAVNLVINGTIAWAVNRSSIAIPLWGQPSIAVDLITTAFFLPFFVCVIVSLQVAGKVKSGKLEPFPPDWVLQVRWFQCSAWKRGLFLGLSGILFAALPVVWALSLGQAQPFPVSSFVIFKAVWAAMLACAITPIVGLSALMSASPPNLVTRRR